jgi:hypothetical protein
VDLHDFLFPGRVHEEVVRLVEDEHLERTQVDLGSSFKLVEDLSDRRHNDMFVA